MSLVRPSLMDRVMVLGIPDSSGTISIQFLTTGFLYGHFAGWAKRGKTEYYPYLVTNRHSRSEGLRGISIAEAIVPKSPSFAY